MSKQTDQQATLPNPSAERRIWELPGGRWLTIPTSRQGGGERRIDLWFYADWGHNCRLADLDRRLPGRWQWDELGDAFDYGYNNQPVEPVAPDWPPEHPSDQGWTKPAGGEFAYHPPEHPQSGAVVPPAPEPEPNPEPAHFEGVIADLLDEPVVDDEPEPHPPEPAWPPGRNPDDIDRLDVVAGWIDNDQDSLEAVSRATLEANPEPPPEPEPVTDDEPEPEPAPAPAPQGRIGRSDSSARRPLKVVSTPAEYEEAAGDLSKPPPRWEWPDTPEGEAAYQRAVSDWRMFTLPTLQENQTAPQPQPEPEPAPELEPEPEPAPAEPGLLYDEWKRLYAKYGRTRPPEYSAEQVRNHLLKHLPDERTFPIWYRPGHRVDGVTDEIVRMKGFETAVPGHGDLTQDWIDAAMVGWLLGDLWEVIDVDNPHLAAAGGITPVVCVDAGAMICLTPGGGWHAIFVANPEHRRKKLLGPSVGVDYLTGAHYINSPRSWRPAHISKNEPKPAGLYLPLWRPPAGVGGWNPAVMPNGLYEAVMSVLGSSATRPHHRTEGENGEGWDMGTRHGRLGDLAGRVAKALGVTATIEQVVAELRKSDDYKSKAADYTPQAADSEATRLAEFVIGDQAAPTPPSDEVPPDHAYATDYQPNRTSGRNSPERRPTRHGITWED